MPQQPEPTFADMVRFTRAFILSVLLADSIALRPDRPRVRGPITPLAEKIFRVLMFEFENVLTGLCFPSIAVIAKTAGGSESQTKELLKALQRTEFLTWRHGQRKRVLTRKGWRVVRSSNRYRLLCPRRHLNALRRHLIQRMGGKLGTAMQALIARYTPPTKEQKATAEIVQTLADDLRPSASRADTTTGSDPPPRAPPTTEGAVDVGGVRVEDPKLGSVLAGLWAALEKQEP